MPSTPDRGPVREREAAQQLGFAPRGPCEQLRALIRTHRLRYAHRTLGGEYVFDRQMLEEDVRRIWAEHKAFRATFDPGAAHSPDDGG